MKKLAIILLAMVVAAGRAEAGDGTWNGNSGNWSAAGTWSGAIADGTNFTANFTDVDITAAKTVTNDTARSIGNITFTDTTPDYDLTIAAGANLTLDVTSGSPVIDVTQSSRTLTIGCVLAGTNGLAKSGSGTLTLSGNNTFTGGTVINAGALTISANASLGASGSRNLTFTGSATLNGFNGASLGALTVNGGATATVSANTMTFASTSGSGNIVYPGYNNANVQLDLGNASAFTGNLRNNIGGHGGQYPGKTIQFTSLGDGGALQFGGLDGNSQQAIRFMLYGNAGPLTMTTRQVQFFGPGGGNNGFNVASLINDNASAVNKWVINSNLLNAHDRAHNLELRGTNTGDNEFAGAIINSTNGGHALYLIKTDNGKWILSGTNTYSGTTTISAGILEISGSGVLGNGTYSESIANSTTFRYNSTATQTLRGVISGAGVLIKSSTGTLTLSGDNNYSGATTVGGGTLILAGNSTCSGATIVTNGMLLGVVGGSSSSSAVTVTNAPGVIAGMGVSVTNNTMQWTCANLDFRTNEAVARLVFDFAEAPGTTVAPLSVTGNLTFAGMPLVVVSPSYIQPGTYPLLTVGGTAPTNDVPPLSGPSGALCWGRTDNKTLLLTVFAKGTVIVLR